MKKIWLVFLVLFSQNAFAMEMDFTWKNLSLVHAKLYPHFIADEYVEDYIQEFHPDRWKLLKEDEFLFEEGKAKFIKEMKTAINNYDLDSMFVIRTSVELGKYDFEKNVFPIEKGVSKTSYFYEKPDHIHLRNEKSFPRKLKVFLRNLDQVGGLEMPIPEAKRFVSDRKNRYGSVDRSATLELTVKIKQLKNAQGDELYAEIIQYRYDTDS